MWELVQEKKCGGDVQYVNMNGYRELLMLREKNIFVQNVKRI